MMFEPPSRPPRRRRRSRPVYSTSVRLSPETIDRIDYVVENEPRVTSRSDAIGLALDHWLRMAEAAIASRRAS